MGVSAWWWWWWFFARDTTKDWYSSEQTALPLNVARQRALRSGESGETGELECDIFH
jgi:hypothetical protein